MLEEPRRSYTPPGSGRSGRTPSSTILFGAAASTACMRACWRRRLAAHEVIAGEDGHMCRGIAARQGEEGHGEARSGIAIARLDPARTSAQSSRGAVVIVGAMLSERECFTHLVSMWRQPPPGAPGPASGATAPRPAAQH